MEFTLLGAAVVAIGAAWLAARWYYRSTPDSDHNAAFELLLNSAVIALAVGRVWAMVEAGINPLSNPGDVIVVRGGVDPLGATLGALAALAWSARRHGLSAWDAVALPALWGLAGWHASCLITGTCLGSVTGVPWAVAAAGSDVGRHPVELYAALLLATGAVILARRVPSTAGRTAAAALVVAAGARLVTEPFRLSLGSGRAGTYLFGVAVGLAGWWALGKFHAARHPTAEPTP